MSRSRSVIALSLTVTAAGLFTLPGADCTAANMPAMSDADTTPSEDDNNNGMMDGSDPGAAAVSFADQIQPIFDTNCIDCHRQGGFADLSGIALRLTTTESLGGLVNQSSSQQPDLTLVVPGDASASLLYQKINTNAPPVGSRMPLLGSPLSQDSVNLIRDWIDQGANGN